MGVSSVTSTPTPQTRVRSLINADSRNLLKSRAPGLTRRFCLTVSGPRADPAFFGAAPTRRAALANRAETAIGSPSGSGRRVFEISRFRSPLAPVGIVRAQGPCPGRPMGLYGLFYRSRNPRCVGDRLDKTRKPALAAPPASAAAQGPHRAGIVSPCGRESGRPQVRAWRDAGPCPPPPAPVMFDACDNPVSSL